MTADSTTPCRRLSRVRAWTVYLVHGTANIAIGKRLAEKMTTYE
jgi:hypothetical protein